MNCTVNDTLDLFTPYFCNEMTKLYVILVKVQIDSQSDCVWEYTFGSSVGGYVWVIGDMMRRFTAWVLYVDVDGALQVPIAAVQRAIPPQPCWGNKNMNLPSWVRYNGIETHLTALYSTNTRIDINLNIQISAWDE